MDLIDKCPATRSGKALDGTDTIDCLSVFATTKYRTIGELAPYVATAFAEVFGGKVGHMEKTEARGFYYTSPDDVSLMIRFDGMDYKSWVANPPEGVAIKMHTESLKDLHTCTCVIEAGGIEYKSLFTADKERDAELISLLIACVTFKRGDPVFYCREKEEPSFDDSLANILPQNRGETKKGFFATIKDKLKGGLNGWTFGRYCRIRGRKGA